METYTKEQLQKAIKHACSSQKFDDYQKAGNLLIGSDNESTAIEDTLNVLCDIDKNVSDDIIKEIDDYLNGGI